MTGLQAPPTRSTRRQTLHTRRLTAFSLAVWVGCVPLIHCVIGCAALGGRTATSQTALEPAAANAEAVLATGRRELAAGEQEQAIDCGDQAIAMNCQCPRGWTLRGLAHAERGDYDRALADLLNAQRLAPEDDELRLEIARVYQARGDHRGCLTSLRGAMESEDTRLRTEALALAGQSSLALGRTHDALESLQLAAASGGPGPDVLAPLVAEANQADGVRIYAADPGRIPTRLAELPTTLR